MSFSQVDTLSKQKPPSFILFHLDSMWTPWYTSKKILQDSVSYFLYSEGKVLTKGIYPMGDFRKIGEICRYTSKLNENGLESSKFYIVKRGFMKGSLTVKINQLTENNYEISIVSAFASFDKRFSARRGELSEIIVEKPKKLKPGKK
jgi:hypothetical protein